MARVGSSSTCHQPTKTVKVSFFEMYFLSGKFIRLKNQAGILTIFLINKEIKN